MHLRTLLTASIAVNYAHAAPDTHNDAAYEVVKRASTTTGSAYCSSSDGTYQLSPYPGPVKGGSSSSGNVFNLFIDDSQNGFKQTITGFGAALTDAAVASINNLTAALQAQALQQIYNTTSGAGFGVVRHTIGSSDLSADPAYTYDDSNTPDTNLTLFNLTDRGRAMAALLARIKAINPSLYILGTAWSPPGWMKSSGKLLANSSADLKLNTLSDRYNNASQPDYSNLSVHVDAIAIQNEPLNNQIGYPTLLMNGTEAGNLIQNYVGPALANNNLNTTIWGHEDNTNGTGGDIASAQAYVDIAHKYVSTIAWHCYYNNTSGGPGLDWTALTTFRANNKVKNPNVNFNQFMSECNTPAPANGGHWYGAANFTIGPLQNWATGAMSWTLSTNIYTTGSGATNYGPHLSTGGCSTCRGLITVVNSTHYGTNIAFYMLAQFSKFMLPGATVLNTTGSTPIIDGVVGIQGIGAVNPGGNRVVVVLNTNSTDLSMVLSTKSGESWTGTVPKNSVVTWLLPAAPAS